MKLENQQNKENMFLKTLWQNILENLFLKLDLEFKFSLKTQVEILYDLFLPNSKQDILKKLE